MLDSIFRSTEGPEQKDKSSQLVEKTWCRQPAIFIPAYIPLDNFPCIVYNKK
jgi:hypothetical protein